MVKKSPMPKPAPPKPVRIRTEEVFYQGASFEHAGTILNYSIHMAGNRSVSWKMLMGAPPAVMPMAVCMTFSVELYLKCLIRLEAIAAPPPKHTLEVLFGAVSSARQARIMAYFDADINPTCTVHNRRLPSGFNFHEALKITSDAFTTCRYAYERRMAKGVNFASYLAPAVRQTIIELRPKWERHLKGLAIRSTAPIR